MTDARPLHKRLGNAVLPTAAALGVLGAVAAATVFGLLYLEFRAPFRGGTFDSAIWSAPTAARAGAADCRRCAMVRDLIDRRLPATRTAVRDLLGPPDKTRQSARGAADCDAWRLGLDLRVSAWWTEAWLYVCYDGSRRTAAFPLVF